MDLKEIQNLIKFVAKAKVNEVKIERKDFKITIKSDSVTKTIQPIETSQINIQEQTHSEQADSINQNVLEDQLEEKTESEDNLITIKSPMIGTFYRAPSPESDDYVQVGDHINADTVVCIVEAMKVMNEIKAEMNGVITEILVENASAVEYGQPLFRVRPA